MKTISLLIIAIAFGLGATAQTTSDTGHHKMNHHYSQSGNHSYYTMQDGKLMMSKNGAMSAVSNDVTLDN